MIHSARQDNDFKLQPGLWREEKLKGAPYKLVIFACPSCNFRSPVKDAEPGKPFEYACPDKKCRFGSLVILDGLENSAGLEKPIEAAKLGG